MEKIAQKFLENQNLNKEEFVKLIRCAHDPEVRELLAERALELRKKYYGDKVYTRGLIEFTNYCKNNCYYCGIQGSNQHANRYRLSKEEILSACENGYQLGYRSFVLQGGEDPHYSDDVMVPIVSEIRKRYQDCAITLSLGERSKESYQKLYDAGADRYLLRHEAATPELYQKLHPESLSLENRIQCLWNLKEIGYAVGTGFMVGAPYQTVENLVDDLLFIQKLDPQMVGIGPFVPHHDTKFKDYPSGTVELTTYLTSILRLMNPHLLLPATTALGTIDPRGREKGILAGANVVMPNLSPVAVRKDYSLYDNKICTGEEAAECAGCLGRRLASIDYELVFTRGDYIE